MNRTVISRIPAISWVVAITLCWCVAGRVQSSVAADTQALTEAQVKALCLLNFAKYVEWPANVFADANAPIIIGCVGEGKVAESLKSDAGGKIIGGRKVSVVIFADDDDCEKCNVLFISASEKRRQAELIKQVMTQPVLTVGESDTFLHDGGAINLIRKDGKIRFTVDTGAAETAHLKISSKLLTLADNVEKTP
jgi:hypothetical protein